jgi:simple sugar transport system substrate-binding protein
MWKFNRLLALLVALILALSACSSVDDDEDGAADTDADTEEAADGDEEAADDTEADADADADAGDSGAVSARDHRIVVVSHGQSSDPFWSVAANGVNTAAEDMGVTVEYQAPGTFDMVEMSQIIDAAVASEPDGLIVTIPDGDALGPSIQAAVDSGIPVISMNSGSDVFQDLGVLVHVGQTEYEAGLIAGQEMAAAGISNALCINQEVGNTALDDRCQGFTDGLGGSVEVVPVELADPTGAQATIAGKLGATTDLDAILALGPTGALPTLAAVQEAGIDVDLATFDLGPEVLAAIDSGEMLFAIDQAQFLQGYLSVTLMTQFLDTGAVPLGSVDRVILTGPQLVTADTASSVIEAAEQGLR